MKLVITTPIAVIVDEDDVLFVRAEDRTGAFGILPGHADFITALSVSVVAWRDTGNETHFVAVREGVMTVDGGNLVRIATRQAVGEDTLLGLRAAVSEEFAAEQVAEEESKSSAARLHLAAIRQLQRYIETGRLGALSDAGAQMPRHPGVAQD